MLGQDHVAMHGEGGGKEGGHEVGLVGRRLCRGPALLTKTKYNSYYIYIYSVHMCVELCTFIQVACMFHFSASSIWLKISQRGQASFLALDNSPNYYRLPRLSLRSK